MPRIFNQTVRTTSTPFDLRPVRVYTDSRTLREGDGTIVGDTTGGDITFTLPTAALCEGRMYVVVKKVAAGTIVVESSGVDTIGYAGLTGVQLTDIDEDVSFLSGGSENVWYACKCGTAQAATVTDVMAIHASTHTGTITFAAFLKPGGPADVEATEGPAQSLVPRDMTITRLVAVPSTALGAGQTADIQFYVNGSADAGITLSFTDADSADVVKAASGTVTPVTGNTLSIGVTLGGGAAAIALRGISYSYEVLPES